MPAEIGLSCPTCDRLGGGFCFACHFRVRGERDKADARVAELEKALEEREADMHLRIRADYDKTVADCWRARVAELEAQLAAHARAGCPQAAVETAPSVSEPSVATVLGSRLKSYSEFIVLPEPSEPRPNEASPVADGFDPEHCPTCKAFADRNRPPGPPVEVKSELWDSAKLKMRQLEEEIRSCSAPGHERSDMLHTFSKLCMFASDAWEMHVIRPAQRSETAKTGRVAYEAYRASRDAVRQELGLSLTEHWHNLSHYEQEAWRTVAASLTGSKGDAG